MSDTNLTANYTGGVDDQYVVVHAFKPDDYLDYSYATAQKLSATNSSVTIDVSNWDIDSLDGYLVTVWMEDFSGSLASATTPEAFYGTTKVDSYGNLSPRVFAMKDKLQSSWGSWEGYSRKYNDFLSVMPTSWRLDGLNPSHQKIYFGTDEDGNPLQFWIAGRETIDDSPMDVIVGYFDDGWAKYGVLEGFERFNSDREGEIMTLYQAKSVEAQPFNASKENYEEILNTTMTTVELPKFGTQRIMVRGSYDVLPAGTQLVANVVSNSPDLDSQNYDMEHQFHYELSLLDKDGNLLSMPLEKKVELLFEVVDGLDQHDLEVILAQVGEDLQFEENLQSINGVNYVGVWTDHFSPYTLIDKLTDEEKAAVMKTGDEITYFTISGLGLIMTLALGLMINSKAKKKRFDE